MALLSAEEKRSIEQAVAAAEQRTAGEVVVVVAERSADYAVFRAGPAAALTVALGVEAAHWFDVATWLLFLAQLPVGALLYTGLGHSAWLRWFVPKAVREEAVQQRAFSEFVQSGVTNTRDRSGVLVFVSEAEHRAVILADQGINARVAADEWQADVDALLEALRKRQAARGLVALVERIGDLLAERFPPRPDDQNELPNAVREV